MQEESIIRSGIEKDGYPEVKKKIESKMRSAAAKARKAARDKYSTALEKLVGEVSGFLSFIDSQFGLMEEKLLKVVSRTARILSTWLRIFLRVS